MQERPAVVAALGEPRSGRRCRPPPPPRPPSPLLLPRGSSRAAAVPTAMSNGAEARSMEEDEEEPGILSLLPDSLLLQILSHLEPQHLLAAGLVSRRWLAVSRDEWLWGRLFHRCYGVQPQRENLKPGATSWLCEFQRVYETAPCVEADVLMEHMDEVLHVAFSHDGTRFTSCSKDCTIKLWRSDDCNLEHTEDMCSYDWKYTQFSQFNSCDTLLLVSGVSASPYNASAGDVLVFSLDDFSMLAQVDTEPYDIFGCWLGRDTFMSGFINHHDMFCLHVHGTGEVDTGGNVHANQNQQGHRLFKFACSNGSYPRMLMVATPGEGQPKPPPPSGGPAASTAKGPSASSGRPSWLLGGSLLRRDHYTSKAAAAAAVVRRRKHQHAMSNERRLPPRERFLVYGTGDLTYASHQIGVKQIPTQPHEYVKRVDGHHTPDHMLELHGQIIGMALSPDHRFLYVNCRAWPAGCVVTEPTEPPAISRDIDTRELELPTLRPTGRSFRGHHAFTAEHNCFFIFLNSSEDFLASGAEDHHGYVWERHYAALLGRLAHSDVVNCVAFNPADQEMLISASDDRNIKVWRSRRAMRRLRLQQQQELAVQS
ncbi:F-box/WD repeat-containing protein 5 isoform X1 [Lampetra fluviatilis]